MPMPFRKEKYLLLDSNIAFHFTRLDHVNWQELVNADIITILISQIFLTELEKARHDHPKKHMRDRATQYSRWLASKIFSPGPIAVNANTYLQVITTEPSIDFSAERLSTTNNDDHLIATYLDFARNSKTETIIVTSDLPLKTKLWSRSITHIEPDDKYRLPSEIDEDKKELNNLRRELVTIKSLFPNLQITHVTGKDYREYCIANSEPSADIDSIVQKAMERYPYRDEINVAPDRTRPPDSIYWAISRAQNTTIQEYNAKQKKYVSDLRRYYEWKNRQPFSHIVELIISNSGKKPATNINVVIRFPDTIELFALLDPPPKPFPPSPKRVRTGWGRGTIPEAVQSPPEIESKQHQDSSKFYLEERIAHYQLDELMHNHSEKMAAFVVSFKDKEHHNFHCDYSIRLREHPDVITGLIHFRFVSTSLMTS